MNYLLIAVLVLGLIALTASLVLYVCSKKFNVEEDNRVSMVAEQLPHANCGGCGYPGCSGFAAALVSAADAGSIEGMSCPVGGAETMGHIASILGLDAGTSVAKVAVVKCAGTNAVRPKITCYSGLRTCSAMNMCSAGETACGYGCLGCGDCVKACMFNAISVNAETGVAEVDLSKCVGCGACVKACPRGIIELREKSVHATPVYVGCMNCNSGPIAAKACGAACIGCGKCAKACPEGAIKIENGLAHIDTSKCTMCGECVSVCPKHVIRYLTDDATTAETNVGDMA